MDEFEKRKRRQKLKTGKRQLNLQATVDSMFDKKVPMKKQVCVIPFKRDFLIEYNKMDPTPLEIIESIDMMRILENGGKVKLCETNYKTKAVDTEEDLALVCKMMKEDKLYKIYKC